MAGLYEKNDLGIDSIERTVDRFISTRQVIFSDWQAYDETCSTFNVILTVSLVGN